MKPSLSVLALVAIAWPQGALADDDPAPAPPAGVAAPSTRGWIGAQERDVWGLAPARATQDYGADVLGGLWLMHDNLQPVFDLGWSRVFSTPNRTIDTFRAGAKVAGGWSGYDGHLWFGLAAGLVIEAGWLHGSNPPLGWAPSPSVSSLLQLRAGRLVVGGEVGLERALPHLAWATYSVFNNVRFQLGLQVGVILGNMAPQ